ncbi:hypothetical protein VP01_921g1 [Puccinia sorghi]|uniref:Uncharacterized protein n=1 Tax=Puccinia sorghi TaxID=27349 RepID=A0A0L6U7A0_9BASI|nr:hypothetical protein VP01_921g1 [Puccinia sorghi]
MHLVLQYFSIHLTGPIPHFQLLCCALNHNPPICIGFIQGLSHFVCLEFKDQLLFPAARVLKNWRDSSIFQAKGWEAKYSRCFDILKR